MVVVSSVFVAFFSVTKNGDWKTAVFGLFFAGSCSYTCVLIVLDTSDHVFCLGNLDVFVVALGHCFHVRRVFDVFIFWEDCR